MKKKLIGFIGVVCLAVLMSFGPSSNFVFAKSSTPVITNDTAENEPSAYRRYVEEKVNYQKNATILSSIYYSDAQGYMGIIPLLSIRTYSTYIQATYGGYVTCSGTCQIYE